MAKFYSDLCNPNRPKMAKFIENGTFEAVATLVIPAGTTVAAADTADMVKLQRGCCVTDGWISSTDLDTGTTLTMSVGDDNQGGSANRYLSASNIGQTGAATVARFDQRAGLGFTFDDNGVIQITFPAGAAGTTGGTIKLMVRGTYDAR